MIFSLTKPLGLGRSCSNVGGGLESPLLTLRTSLQLMNQMMTMSANLVDNDVKYLLCDPAVHGKPRHLTSQLKNVVMFAVPISDKSFNMKINWYVSWRIYWHSYG